MTPSAGRSFRALAREAVLDAAHRRMVVAIAVVSLLSLLAVDRCTSCRPAVFETNGQLVDPSAVAGWSGTVIYVVLGLWTLVLAGVLASDQLAQTLLDGSAALALARPVSRSAFALARLAGALAIALATGAVLLVGSASLLYLRMGVSLE